MDHITIIESLFDFNHCTTIIKQYRHYWSHQVPIVNTSSGDEDFEDVEEIGANGLLVNPNGHYERFEEIDLDKVRKTFKNLINDQRFLQNYEKIKSGNPKLLNAKDRQNYEKR